VVGRRLSRRRFLAGSTLLLAGAHVGALGCRGAGRRKAGRGGADGATGSAESASSTKATPRAREIGPLVLGAELRLTLAAVASRILPSDDGPGASEADCTEYVARQLEDPRMGKNRQLVLRGLVELDNEAARRAAKSYRALSASEQDEVLAFAARGQLKLGKVPSDAFVRALVVLVLEGFLGDPGYGGNRNRVGWQSIEYAAIHHGGRVRTRQRGRPL
jgi:gluconate 2-dehydrogenase gamma chain